MKWQFLFAVFLLISISFSFFDDFSLSNLSNANAMISLSDMYNPNISQNSSVLVAFGRTSRELYVSTSLDLAGFSTMYENSIYPTEDLSVFFASGSVFSPLTSISSSGYPDFNCNTSFLGDYAWRCDFDSDDCVEYINNTFTEHNLTTNISFHNYSILAPFNSTMLLPDELIDLMKNSSGSDNLTIHIYGQTSAGYTINDRSMGNDCSNNYKNYSANFTIDQNYSIPVLGTHSMFFLVAPVLNEQWFRNNRFDVVVLSQAPLSKAGYYFDNSSVSKLTIRHFDFEQNTYGITYLVSDHSDLNTSNYSESVNYTKPTPISRENQSYSYIYRFNYSYLGLGNHNLSFYVFDPFKRETSYFNQTLTSRMLSYDNAYMENRMDLDKNLSRPSNQYTIWSIQNVSFVLGGISIIILISFIRFFMR
jgi:hypothetical protein